MNLSVKSLPLLALLCGALVVCVPGPASAASSATKVGTPCWKQVMNDWYTPPITQTYAQICYTQAIDHLPTELKIYSSAKEDILAAKQAAANGQSAPAEVATTITTTTTTPEGVVFTTTSVGPPTSGSTTPSQTTTNASGFSGIINKITPGNPDSFPLPLLILGALAILLIAAGGVGMIWQRSHPRTDPPAPA